MDASSILRELLGKNATNSRRVRELREGDGKRMGRALEDLLGVRDDDEPSVSSRQPRRAPAPRQEPRERPKQQPAPSSRPSGGLLDDLLGGIFGGERRQQPQATPKREERQERQRPELVPRRRPRPSSGRQQQAVFLIRAMCNAAKVDGDIDRAEQDAILDRLGNDVTEEELDFVRQELRTPLQVKQFCRSVPEELAEQVYGFSVMAMKVDTLKEAAYLGRLAQGLDLDPRVCDRLHDKVGAPHLFC